MPVGNNVVLIGMSERTSRQAITQVALALSSRAQPSTSWLPALPSLRAAMHLDTVFTFADRDVVTLFLKIVDSIQPLSLRPSDAAPGLEVIEQGGTFVEVCRFGPGPRQPPCHRDRRDV